MSKLVAAVFIVGSLFEGLSMVTGRRNQRRASQARHKSKNAVGKNGGKGKGKQRKRKDEGTEEDKFLAGGLEWGDISPVPKPVLVAAVAAVAVAFVGLRMLQQSGEGDGEDGDEDDNGKQERIEGGSGNCEGSQGSERTGEMWTGNKEGDGEVEDAMMMAFDGSGRWDVKSPFSVGNVGNHTAARERENSTNLDSYVSSKSEKGGGEEERSGLRRGKRKEGDWKKADDGVTDSSGESSLGRGSRGSPYSSDSKGWKDGTGMVAGGENSGGKAEEKKKAGEIGKGLEAKMSGDSSLSKGDGGPLGRREGSGEEGENDAISHGSEETVGVPSPNGVVNATSLLQMARRAVARAKELHKDALDTKP